MLDIEFVSELAIGLLHGPQNKKASLERWYTVYEEEFEEREQIESVFRVTLGEIDQLLPRLSRTRWGKKSDFYTLFLYLGARSDEFPLTREDREGASAQLLEFSDMVNAILRLDPSETATVVKPALDYARAVQRAASDLGNRRQRARALSEFMSGELGTVQLNAEGEPESLEDEQFEDAYDEE